MVRLALVDDHELFRFALSSVLTQRGFDMVVQAGDARSSFPLIDHALPDVVLLDIALPGMDGVAATRELMTRPVAPKVLVLSAHDSPQLVTTALDAGALGYALKSHSIDELLQGIEAVVHGRRYIAPGLSTPAGATDGSFSQLTARERDVFHLIVRGKTTIEIGRELCISPKTVETHRQRVLRKLDVHSAVQLVRFAVVNDLLMETGNLAVKR